MLWTAGLDVLDEVFRKSRSAAYAPNGAFQGAAEPILHLRDGINIKLSPLATLFQRERCRARIPPARQSVLALQSPDLAAP